MKICAACCNELPQSNFSKKQWKLKQYERRCTDCIADNRELQLKPPPKTEKEDKPTCYICLDDGPDELGGEVMRNWSCRGSAVYVHLSCAVKYAEQKFNKKKDEEKEDAPYKDLPERAQALKIISQSLKLENLNFEIEKTQLHYLDGEILVDFYLSIDYLKNKTTEQIQSEFSSALEKLPGFGQVKVYYS